MRKTKVEAMETYTFSVSQQPAESRNWAPRHSHWHLSHFKRLASDDSEFDFDVDVDEIERKFAQLSISPCDQLLDI